MKENYVNARVLTSILEKSPELQYAQFQTYSQIGSISKYTEENETKRPSTNEDFLCTRFSLAFDEFDTQS